MTWIKQKISGRALAAPLFRWSQARGAETKRIKVCAPVWSDNRSGRRAIAPPLEGGNTEAPAPLAFANLPTHEQAARLVGLDTVNAFQHGDLM
ncbi:MAG: hypothetical protein KIS73_29540 [Enhydrobacter sp.]|nr:hypothetical protein [Enhydrobacter sp.]